jgi:hypothetical protein
MEETMTLKFTYQRDKDGCDSTWDIRYPDGSYLVSIPFWDAVQETEAEARLIVNALNRYMKTMAGAADYARCVAPVAQLQRAGERCDDEAKSALPKKQTVLLSGHEKH